MVLLPSRMFQRKKKTTAGLLVYFSLCCAVCAAEPRITDLQVIPLQDSVTTIRDFDVAGKRHGMIVKAWRENGNAHSYNVYLVMLHTLSSDNVGAEGWLLADVMHGVPPHEVALETLRDDPLTGEDDAISVWFAKGKLDGKPTTFLMTAERDLSNVRTNYDPVPVTLTVYKLTAAEDPVGTTPFVFEQVSLRRSTRKYQNSECAMAKEFKLPVPKDVGSDCSEDGKE